MAYNLYQVQMSNAWAERINKEMAQAEKFWNQQVQQLEKSGPGPRLGVAPSEVFVGEAMEARSMAGESAHARSAAPTGFTSKTAFLRSRMEKLEAELLAERESRRKVEEDLQQLRTSMKRR
ncbi:hypothetical protein VOLCADRAFT_106853 [Volvox carteri f. nagariensis]|uniref:Uncharacterized protein n=1 Tax=Volvox carteri f. nagariensis TaxID=3068 RepID=D8UA63_VOLCA|nr:uncharacterized protein VOLCADRAFT_106853 [Volvox carteri f. nagariensis]EFJ43418.1 hypothetical protein VOLCADRAFT_106853 [Volvox carteri f. nagariensis]|eukprot:XP_002955565.1 hypothetical protein VOLCADRAFT_106853 [Volvox carteri f. nagariensis]